MSDPIRDLLEREAVIDTITELFVATDRRDWAAVRQCFAPRVHFDMSSAGGGEPAEVAAEESGRNTRVFVGSYDFQLRLAAGRWQINRFRFELKFLDGDLQLEAAAETAGMQPASAGQRRDT